MEAAAAAAAAEEEGGDRMGCVSVVGTCGRNGERDDWQAARLAQHGLCWVPVEPRAAT